jgi:hypothetical protein
LNESNSFEEDFVLGSGHGHDDRNDRQPSGNTEGGFRRGGGGANDRGGFSDRRGNEILYSFFSKTISICFKQVVVVIVIVIRDELMMEITRILPPLQEDFQVK